MRQELGERETGPFKMQFWFCEMCVDPNGFILCLM